MIKTIVTFLFYVFLLFNNNLFANENGKKLTNKARDYIIENLSMNARIDEYTDLYI